MKQTNAHSYFRDLRRIIAAAFLFAGCTHLPTQLSGGGSDTEVSGKILSADGTAKPGVAVALIAQNYDPAFDGNLPTKMTTVTDTAGKYRFDSLSQGVYNVQADLSSDGTKILINSIEVDSGKANVVANQTLKKTATLEIVLADSLLNSSGFITMPGTLISKAFGGVNGIVVIDSVPQGFVQSIQFKKSRTDSTVLFRNVTVGSEGIILLNSFNAVTGLVFAADGSPAVGAFVTLIPSGFNPAFSGVLDPKLSAIADGAGAVTFYNIDQGPYTVFAKSQSALNMSLGDSVSIGPIAVTMLPFDTVKKTAVLIVPLPDSLAKYSGQLFVPGTFLSKAVHVNSGSVEFDSVPQGKLSSIVFQQTSVSQPVVLFRDVTIGPSDTINLNPWALWPHSAKVTINTAAAGLMETELNFPVLVRLNASNFNFKQARTNGEDIRFVKQDGSALPLEIEDWDSANASATIWVKVDTVLANTIGQYLVLMWGNSGAKTASNPSAVFDTANGFQGVWHLAQSGPNIQKDATSNHFDATPTAMTGSSDVVGVIARALDFDGSSQCVTALNARGGKLDVQTDSFYTVSSWVYARTLNQGLHVFVSKGSAQYGLMVNKANRWEFFGGLTGYGVDTTTTAPAVANVWTLVTGVRKGMKQYLYVNGILADSALSAAGTNPGISNNFYDFVIGRQSDDQSQWFDGIVDETRVESVARAPGWTQMCYQNQRSDQIMVQVIPVK
jgi:Concanavalin A-like lectin/glucanases superfamily/Domain of unknown function (DUF2341)/Carboxypeptidase regulatory-like domain